MIETFCSHAHLTDHFGVIALKFAICFDCVHQSRRDLLFEHLFAPFSGEVTGQVPATEHNPGAGTDSFPFSRTFQLNGSLLNL